MKGQQAAPPSSPGAHIQLQGAGGQAENHGAKRLQNPLGHKHMSRLKMGLFTAQFFSEGRKTPKYSSKMSQVMSSVGVGVHFETSLAKATVLRGGGETTRFPEPMSPFQLHRKSSFPSGVELGRGRPRCSNCDNILPKCPCSRKWVTLHSFASEEPGGQRLGLLPHLSRTSHNPLYIY